MLSSFNFRQFQKLYLALLILVGIIMVGTAGYMVIEGYPMGSAFYMTIITISTVGFQEVRPLSEFGRLFTSVLIITSFGTFAYALGALSSYLLDGEFRKYFREIKAIRQIKNLNNHIIVCGYGRNGRQVVQELKNHGQDYVVIEQSHEVVEHLQIGLIEHVIEGDAVQDETMEQAGIHRAKALITTLPDDASNLFVVLTARDMNPKIKIISRASEDTSYRKLRRAGADNVIMPDKVGGSHMASLVVKPDVIEFFNHLMGQGGDAISLEEIVCSELPKEFMNQSIQALEVRKHSGANIVGFKNRDGEYIINPAPDTIITPQSKVFVLGTKEQIQRLRIWEKSES